MSPIVLRLTEDIADPVGAEALWWSRAGRAPALGSGLVGDIAASGLKSVSRNWIHQRVRKTRPRYGWRSVSARLGRDARPLSGGRGRRSPS
jgi:hypothetical protein